MIEIVDGRTTDSGVTGILLDFGSGELIITVYSPTIVLSFLLLFWVHFKYVTCHST